jgi:hypothetical protein
MEEEESEAQTEEEAEGGGGLYRHADMYQKAVATFLDDATLNAVFMDRSLKIYLFVWYPPWLKRFVNFYRWMKMAEESRMAVVDRTFDAMVGVKILLCVLPIAHSSPVHLFPGPADHNKYFRVQDVEKRPLPAVPRNFSRISTVWDPGGLFGIMYSHLRFLAKIFNCALISKGCVAKVASDLRLVTGKWRSILRSSSTPASVLRSTRMSWQRSGFKITRQSWLKHKLPLGCGCR